MGEANDNSKNSLDTGAGNEALKRGKPRWDIEGCGRSRGCHLAGSGNVAWGLRPRALVASHAESKPLLPPS